MFVFEDEEIDNLHLEFEEDFDFDICLEVWQHLHEFYGFVRYRDIWDELKNRDCFDELPVVLSQESQSEAVLMMDDLLTSSKRDNHKNYYSRLM